MHAELIRTVHIIKVYIYIISKSKLKNKEWKIFAYGISKDKVYLILKIDPAL